MGEYAALISERKPAFGWGLRCLLEDEAGIRTVYSVSCIEEALHQAARDASIRLIVIDLAIDGMRYVEGARRLHASYPAILVVVLSDPEDVQRAEATYAGIGDHFLPANAPLSEFLRVFKRAAGGGSSETVGRASWSFSPSKAPPIAMSKRQTEVIRLVVAGHSNKQIARVLSVAEGTVKAHVAAVYRKLGVTNRTAAYRKLQATSIIEE